MDLALEVRGFAKSFRRTLFGKKTDAAVSIDLEVPRGEIFGFLGPNGAGKTTTIKALIGLIAPDAGQLRVLGEEPNSFAWRRRVGYAAEHPVFPTYLTGLEMVRWFAELSGLGRTEAKQAAQKALDLVGLEGAHDRRLRGYSKGMLQRSALAQAIVGDPELLILDEPMTGLDPIGRRDVRELILEMKRRGSTVFYSTHILPDIEATCDRVAIINKGRTYTVDSLAHLMAQGEGSWGVTLEQVWDSAPNAKPPALHPATGHARYQFETKEEANSFAGQALQAGCTVRELAPHRQDLESIFVASLEGDAS